MVATSSSLKSALLPLLEYVQSNTELTALLPAKTACVSVGPPLLRSTPSKSVAAPTLPRGLAVPLHGVSKKFT